MTSIQFPLNDVQISLLELSESLREDELQDLKKLIIAFKAHRLALLAEHVWNEKGWSEQTMQQFLNTHLRTSYKPKQHRQNA